ncbi:MAG TPA: hypothetical protein VN700_03285 [Vicinamibacterales bacterium]|nr:hypothetical protein [Vicinamibacterales bacterium]
MSREIRSYDYVNQPFSEVRGALLADPIGTFRDATRVASARAQSLSAELSATIAGIDVSAEIACTVGQAIDEPAAPYGSPVMRLPISWEAAHHPRLFPLMNGVLSIYPLTSTETQIDYLGQYEPPLGGVGSALDAIVGHRIAEASVHRLIRDVAHHLRAELGRRNSCVA